MKHSESIAKIAAALVAAQADIRAVEKSATNPHFKSKYVPLDAIIAMARPALAKHGIAIVQAGNPFDDGRGLLVETRLVHDSGEWISGIVYIPFGKADPQGAGAAMTYGRRFGLSALLSISSEDDDDGNIASRPAAKRSERGTGGPANAGTAAVGHSAAGETGSAATAPTRAAFVDQTKVLPFGKSKGTPIKDMHPTQLADAVAWAKANKPEVYKGFIDAAELILDELRVGA